MSGSSSMSPRMVTRPNRPPKTCLSESPCRCEWYQYVPAGWSSGIPDVELSLREVVRVLKPGGRFVFAGEPTTVGNGYARTLANLTWNVTIRAMKLPGLSSWRRPQAELDENSRAAALEWIVDLHTFGPGELEKMATNAGAVEVSTETDSSLRDAGMAGTHFRVDSAAREARLGLGQVCVRQLDDVVVGGRERLAPCRAEGLVYNVMVTGVKPS